eukprot:NODE_2712_length_515_cov_155.162371_g2662_i0.p1 GENE.NODE_2712_length_515_cov_155.162371_g2662_i0~~NODE_2712_length_515_cov_155.162371_g2662_i0.p1  ORF type:complete len:113 (+),score=39.26 NODE_2712_length_515_cov_155.162371_g2662_i0:71-409(+)
MPPKKDKKADPKKGKAKPTGGAGGKAKKKKWSKGKVREKLNNMVMWDEATKDKLFAEVPKSKVITISVVSDRLKVSGALAREGLKLLEAEGKIKPVFKHSRLLIYTRKQTAK